MHPLGMTYSGRSNRRTTSISCFLLDQDRIGQPFGVVNLMDKTDNEELANLFPVGLVFFFVEEAWSILHHD